MLNYVNTPLNVGVCVITIYRPMVIRMNGPQRTACLANGYINSQFSLTFPVGRTKLSSMVT